MNKKFIILLFLIFSPFFLLAQNPFANKHNGLITSMVSSFEKQIVKHYNINNNETNKAYRKYLTDFTSSSIDFKTITTKETLKLLKLSNKDLANYIWITNKKKQDIFTKKLEEQNEEEIIVFEQVNQIKNSITDKEEERYNNTLSVNYTGDFYQDLHNSSKNNDFKEILLTLKDVPDINPTLISAAFRNFSIKDLKSDTIKTFIAFEFYYAILNILNQNE